MARYHARVAGTIGEHLHVVVEMGRRPAEGDALEGEASAPVSAACGCGGRRRVSANRSGDANAVWNSVSGATAEFRLMLD